MSGALAGARVLVTRPEHQAAGLVEAIERRGGIALRLPLLDILPAGEPAELAARLTIAAQDDWWLFTSRNAAEAACRLLPVSAWRARIAAVGEGTASVLRAAGVAEVLVPQGRYSAAALLAMPELGDFKGLRITIVTGADSRPELGQRSRARGARVTVLPLYRRAPRSLPPETVAPLLAAAHAAVVTSGSGLEQLLAVTPPSLLDKVLRLQLVVPAPRMVELARSHGFIAPALLPDQVTDAACARALARWWSLSSSHD